MCEGLIERLFSCAPAPPFLSLWPLVSSIKSRTRWRPMLPGSDDRHLSPLCLPPPAFHHPHLTSNRNANQGVVYPAAALGVVFDPRTGHQVYHTGHQGDIISLTISKCGRFAASGDAARRPRVHVWNAVTGAGVIATGLEDVEAGIVSALPPIHRIGVGLLAFSSDGHWLASMGHDPEHTLAIYK